MKGMLELVEDERFCFDEAAADRPVRFIEKYCRHFTGRFSGKPFLLEPIQKKIIRDVFGWKWRSTGYRRFNFVYWEGAVGCGKSPLLAAIGLYMLGWDGEPGAEVYSVASTHTQARVVFDAAKKFRKASPELSVRLEAVQYEIRHPRTNSFWRLVSGDGPGAGAKPSAVMADEIHDWKNSAAHDDLHDRMLKRDQPIFWAATNAGETRACFCWELREKAIAALQGTGDPTIYPIIWTVAVDQGKGFKDEDIKTDDPANWICGNPLMGITVSKEKTAAKCTEAMKDPKEESNFRRLILGIWPKGVAGRWLNLHKWDQATLDFDGIPAEAPLYIGIDGSMVDDLTAVVYVGVMPGRIYLDADFWVPRVTADRYHDDEGIPYRTWADQKYINLVDEPTLSPNVKTDIALSVMTKTKGRKVMGVYYDPEHADETVTTLEQAQYIVMPMRQGYSISNGCSELERRLKDDSITITPNEVLRFCAENCTVKTDDRGNYWPVKPNANPAGGDGYKGLRSAKVDGITAAVTALTMARKHSFPKNRPFRSHQISVA